MFATLADLRVRAGLVATDTSKDVEIQLTHDTALALIESYCDRKFEFKVDWKERFIHMDRWVLSLERYPVARIKDVRCVLVSDWQRTGNVDPVAGKCAGLHWHYDKRNGLIHFDSHIHEHVIDVIYDGGYADAISQLHPFKWPGDLLLCLYQLFDALYQSLSGGGGTSTVVAGAIQSVTIPDVGTVRFGTGSGGATGGAAGASGDYITPTVAGILNTFRRELC